MKVFVDVLKTLWFVIVGGVVAIAVRRGLLTETLEVDHTGISWIIMAMFVVTMAYGFIIHAGPPWKIRVVPYHRGMKLQMLMPLRYLKESANLQVFLGLWGTMLGLYLIFRGLPVSEGMSGEETTEVIMAAVPNLLMALWTSILGMAGGGLVIVTYLVLGGKGTT